MKRLCLVGLGVITKHYQKGLEDSNHFDLVAVCDCNEGALARNLYSSFPFYTDYKAMIETESPDVLLIATPPATHFEIAEYALKKGVGVILEKPATLSLDDLKRLQSISEELCVPFTTMFHWQTGEEVIYFNKSFDNEKITEIEVYINDCYSLNGVSINKDRISLGGAWIDSGVNALSLVDSLVPFDDYEIIAIDVQKCTETALPIFVKARLNVAHNRRTISVTISVDWRNDSSSKYTLLNMSDDSKIIIEHTAQTIKTGDNDIVLDDMPRLQRHYYNYFTNFEGSSADDALKIHQLLFEVNKHI
ncbi:MAG: Gfo/Idh/MocA family oxidoreductase [Clostridia bacterium]|nr:Gfo/Idh/MocA family oxidoreductase [Clostridia bacterium]